MRRLTTPEHTFRLDIDPSMVDKFLLTYAQNGQIVLEKTGDDMTVTDNVWSIELKQDETKLFKPGVAFAQIRVLTVGGDALATDPMRFDVGDVFNEEVLS